MKSNTAESAAASAPPTEELLKKIQELELGQARLKQEMSHLITSSSAAQIVAAGHRQRQRSHSISPQRAPRRRVDRDGCAWKKGSTSFRHSSPLQRESRRSTGDGEPAAVEFTDKQYFNILQSMGQSIHIMDPDNRLIYWLVKVELYSNLPFLYTLVNLFYFST